MKVVIPIAGESSRFQKVTRTPKWALKMGKQFILEWAISSLEIDNEESSVNLVFWQGHKDFLDDVLADTQLAFSVELTELKYPSLGQADSVEACLVTEEEEESLVIWNGDTYVDSPISLVSNIHSNYLALSRLEGTNWSFARTERGRVVETAEKKKIGEMASIGLYGWETQSLFTDSLKRFHESGDSNESYVAPLYNHAIRDGHLVRAVEVDPESFHSMGTPSELELTSKKLGLEISDPLSAKGQSFYSS